MGFNGDGGGLGGGRGAGAYDYACHSRCDHAFGPEPLKMSEISKIRLGIRFDHQLENVVVIVAFFCVQNGPAIIGC